MVGMMVQQVPEDIVDRVENREEVRIYRLHLLEENQVRILHKIEDLESKLDEKYNEKIKNHDIRLKSLESRNDFINWVAGVVFIETIAILGFIVKSWLGV